MALIKCPDCRSDVSDAAPACPRCGYPITGARRPAPRKSSVDGVAKLLFFVILFGMPGMWLYIHFVSNPRYDAEQAALNASPQPVSDPSLPKACDPADAQCAFQANAGDAIVGCKEAIEQKSAHTVKWNDSFLGPHVFLSEDWNDNAHTSLSLLGDAVEFQNDYGAMTPMSYSCTFDLATQKVTNVIMFEGKLKDSN